MRISILRKKELLLRTLFKIKNRLQRRINVLKSIRYRFVRNAVYYIDGDNNPLKRLVGIEKLPAGDIVKIFCAEDSSYFRDYKRREELKQRCSCSLKFIPVKPGPDAVDFAIGMDAYGVCLKDPGSRIYLLSSDRHFRVISQQLRAMTHNSNTVWHMETISDAYIKDESLKFKGIWSYWGKNKK